MDVAWIETTEALLRWTSHIGEGPLAVDTEADSFHHYREKVCLVQLSANGRHALVDPLADVDLCALEAAFSNRSLRKILHGADYDVRMLARDFGLVPLGLTDTMIAARLLGEPAHGLAALLEKYLGVKLDKSHQRADWSKRPISEAMRAYAVLDTCHLETLASLLDAQLEALGRTAWMREECLRLERVRWRDRREEDPEPYRRAKGGRALDRAGLAVLRELWGWRDAIARHRDKPLFKVLRDETLVALAATPPASIADLSRVPGFPDHFLRSPSGLELLEAVRRGLACPEDERPMLRAETRVRLAPAVEARVAAIRVRRDEVARALALDPSVLATRGMVEEMAGRWERGDDPWEIAELREWQVGILRPVLEPGVTRQQVE